MNSRYKRKQKERRIENKERNRKTRRKVIIAILTIIVLILLYGKFIEPNMLSINDYKIVNSDLPKSFDGVRILHISDIHYGKGFNYKRLDKLVKTANELKPDIVVFTGDLIDKDFNISDESYKKLTDGLKGINSNYGKYAIYGNHDINNDNFKKILKEADFKLLINNYDNIYNKNSDPIAIYGFDDILYGSPKTDKLKDKNIKDIKYKIVLVHEPDYIDKFVNDFELSLILAGHSHGGQAKIPGIRPLFLPEGSKTYYKKYYNVDDTDIYISNGVGSSIIDFRLFTTPSINLYRIYSK